MKDRIERRFIEVRAVDGAEDEMIVEGYPIVFNQPATQRNGNRSFTEVIKAGALDGADIKDVVMRYNHSDKYMIMARTRNKSLKLEIEPKGLKINARLIDTQANRDIYKGIKEGLIDKMSFAFRVKPKGDKWIFGENDTQREIYAIEKLFDVAVVDTPFYDTTSVTARSFELLEEELERLEEVRAIEREKLKIKIRGQI